ncbi:transposase [Paenibacillus chitinolyticus]|uniref:transposase n=1 Tax=Paenibacillus chitinolyticus TaxID=79263 RepID=UPI003D083E51
MDELLMQIPFVPQLLVIKGIGRDTFAGFLAEVGDIEQYRHPKRILKLAGLKSRDIASSCFHRIYVPFSICRSAPE